MAVLERSCSVLRDWSTDSLVVRDSSIVSRPAISSSSIFRSVWSALPRKEPRALWKNVPGGASDIFRSRTRSRLCLARSISLVASIPACFRASSSDFTSGGRDPKLCQGELMEAKPERRDMIEIPMTATRSRDASL